MYSANKEICDQLSLSVSQKGIMETFWVGAEKDAQEAVVEEEDSEVVITGRGLENCNVL